MAAPDLIDVSVACALPARQWVVPLRVQSGTTALQAVTRSGILALFPEVAAGPLTLAIHGRRVDAAALLADGDRVELLRPLPNDPQQVRRERARRGETMGRGAGTGRGRAAGPGGRD